MTNEEFIKSIQIDGEIWEEIPGWENIYYASTLGRVASAPRTVMRSQHKMRLRGKVMKQLTDKLGYKYVFLRKEEDYQRIFVHKCVAITFIPNPLNKTEIDHIDTNPANNCVQNLRWVSSSENHLNPITLRRLIEATPLKEEVGIVATKGGIDRVYRSYSEAERNGFNRSGIRRCIHNGQSEYQGFRWRILNDSKSISSSTSLEQF